MDYNMPYWNDLRGPYYAVNLPNQPTYPEEDLMAITASYMENIDPLLPESQMQQSVSPWGQQQQRLQRFMSEPERNLFTAAPLSSYTQSYVRQNRPEIISPLPQANLPRIVSPAPSRDISSQCSSAMSPGEDAEWHQGDYYQPHQDVYSFPNTASHSSRGLPKVWNVRSQAKPFLQPAGFSCVSMDQVQVFADPQEITFESDEGFVDMEKKMEYPIEVNQNAMKTMQVPSHMDYRHSCDEGLGESIKGGGTPEDTTISNLESDFMADPDVDAEGDDDIVVLRDPASDTEYTPKSTRTRKRRAPKVSPKAIPGAASKRNRVAKAKAKSKPGHLCKSCDHSPFKDAAALQRHLNSSHARAFICVFDFAGCSSTFGSKNEWKRHVSSQHLNLNAWVCELGTCGKVQPQSKRDGGGTAKGSEFNRKDLFTQHLRRMHAPFEVKHMKKENLAWEERIKDLQTSCLRVKRQPPAHLSCPLNNCDEQFQSSNCWDERMEHVAKHLEIAAASTGANKFTVKQQDDQFLVNWALRERVIEGTANGEFRLCGAGSGRNQEEDAEGDYE